MTLTATFPSIQLTREGWKGNHEQKIIDTPLWLLRYSVIRFLVTVCTFYPADVWHTDWLHSWFEKKIKTFKFQMTFVSSEDYSQSKSFMVKGSRSSVKKKKNQ